MAVAGLKIDFLKFWKGQKLAHDDVYHVSKNISKNSNFKGSKLHFALILQGSLLNVNS